MSPQVPHKTLAKTMTYIACHAPEEHGLFWDPEGTMPWKEFYWALQEDESLRFVRESMVRELELVGIPLPFTLEDGRLKLRSLDDLPSLEVCKPPDILHYWARRKQIRGIMKYGLKPDGKRTYLPLSSDRDLALRIAKRRDPNPIPVQVMAGRAHAEGIRVLDAGQQLYLIEQMPADYLVLPPISAEDLDAVAPRKRKPASKEVTTSKPLPMVGSYRVDPSHLMYSDDESEGERSKRKQKKRGKGPDWKRKARGDRRKREL